MVQACWLAGYVANAAILGSLGLKRQIRQEHNAMTITKRSSLPAAANPSDGTDGPRKRDGVTPDSVPPVASDRQDTTSETGVGRLFAKGI